MYYRIAISRRSEWDRTTPIHLANVFKQGDVVTIINLRQNVQVRESFKTLD